MHESAISQSIVKTVLNQANKQNAAQVESVEIEIGELTFLNPDQVEFWVKIGFEGTIAETASVIIKKVKGILNCKDCDYSGSLNMNEDSSFHVNIPLFYCPQCQRGNIEIIQGKEALIRRIKILKN
jgi:hydrogenase nickel incorporation protein HypA/HybF